MRALVEIILLIGVLAVMIAAGVFDTPTGAAVPQAAVKGAGQAATTNDPALVVTTSPNTPTKQFVSAGAGQFALAIGTGTTLTVPAGTKCGQFTLEGANVRRTSDGTVPSTAGGTLIQVGAQWQDCGPLAAYQFTAVTAGATLDVEYFK